MNIDNYKDFQRKPLVGMNSYTEGFFAGRRFALNETVRLLTELAKDLEQDNPTYAALLVGTINDLENKLK